jgi:hypothetical protein
MKHRSNKLGHWKGFFSLKKMLLATEYDNPSFCQRFCG